MIGLKKSITKEVIVPGNFQALEEAISEITECENIRNEKEFFDLYQIKILKLDCWITLTLKESPTMLRKEIKGKRYVMVPEEAWDEIVDIFKIIRKNGEQNE